MSATAALVADEVFFYPDGMLSGNNGGSGWSTAWTFIAGSAATVQTAAATVSFAGANPGSESARTLAAARGAGTTTWLRFFGRMTSNGQVDTSYGGVGLYAGTTERLLIGKNWPGPENWTLSARNSSGTTAVYLSTTALGDAGFDDIWLKIVNGPGSNDDAVSLWINPTNITSEAALGAALATHSARHLDFDTVRLRGGTSVGSHSETWTFDTLGIGTEFADVAASAPSTPPGNYSAWSALWAPGQDFNQDHDSDGMPNGLEFFFGESGSGFTANPPLASDGVISWPMNESFTGSYISGYEVQASSDLLDWTRVPAEDLVIDRSGPTPMLRYAIPDRPDLQRQFVRLAVLDPRRTLSMGIHPTSGNLQTLKTGDLAMNWIGTRGQWGEPSIKGVALSASSPEIAGNHVTALWSGSGLTVGIERALAPNGQALTETYRFTNTTGSPLTFTKGDIGIRLPLADDYLSGATVCLTARCHAHLWAQGTSAWVCAMQMNGKPGGLGLTLTHGALDGYSIVDRAWTSNDRGIFVVHPKISSLPPGETAEVSWTVFTHLGWDDFFTRAAAVNPGFVRLQADAYCAMVGETITIRAIPSGALDLASSFQLDGSPVPSRFENGTAICEITAAVAGHRHIEFISGGRRETMEVSFVPPMQTTLENRAEFLMDHKQVIQPGNRFDGSFPPFDLETNQKVLVDDPADWNAARERLGSGVLLGLLWKRTPAGPFRDQLLERFLRFYQFVNREIQNSGGVVYNNTGYSGGERIYNYPWVMRVHLTAWQVTGNVDCLTRLALTIRTYYARHGSSHSPIGIPIRDAVAAFQQQGMAAEVAEATQLFRDHADAILERGINIPAHEVAYEQSIVGPMAQILLEVALVTGGEKYLGGAKEWMPALIAFNGLQPDFRLHDISIRHWDGYWFGKRKMYGDTMPHYWSTITADVFQLYSGFQTDLQLKDSFAKRARAILLANTAVQFQADGGGRCANLYPFSINGNAGNFNDPLDNDQDWTLVSYLLNLPTP